MAWSPCVALVWLGFVLGLSGSPGLAQTQTGENPSQGEEAEILERIHAYAERYVANLPDFVCEQITYQSQAGKKSKHWHKRDTLISKLAFNEGHEEHTLELVNNKPPSVQKVRNDPLITEGEFGSMMQVIFSTDSHADFAWSGWQDLNGRRLAVFTYSIDKQHSSLKLGLTGIAGAVVPYRGSITADPASGAIRQITYVPHDIPPEVQTDSIATTIDYDSVLIGGRSYLLPSRAVVAMVTPYHRVRNEMEFRNYRKFEAESKITFGSDSGHRPVSPD